MVWRPRYHGVDGGRRVSLWLYGQVVACLSPPVLRVYDRDAGPAMSLVHSLRGHRHQNWPIRSAFMRSFDSTRRAYQDARVWRAN